MTSFGRFSLRVAIYGSVLAYLATDLFLIEGPLKRRLVLADPKSPQAIASAKKRGIVARVYHLEITRDQVERALHDRLWSEGKTVSSLPPKLLQVARYAALNDLIDHALLRVKAKVNATELHVSDKEIDKRLRSFESRFESPDAMNAALQSQGLGNRSDLRARLAARMQQERYVESRVAPLAQVTDEEVQAWLDTHQQDIALPERVRARHVFVATLERPSEEAKALLEVALGDLTSQRKDFASLVRELSEDPATTQHEGDLGWMTRQRIPADLANAMFSLNLHQPTLVKSSIGWHLMEITDRKDAEPADPDKVAPEARAALEALKRRAAVQDFRDALRRLEAEHIIVFHDMMESAPSP